MMKDELVHMGPNGPRSSIYLTSSNMVLLTDFSMRAPESPWLTR